MYTKHVGMLGRRCCCGSAGRVHPGVVGHLDVAIMVSVLAEFYTGDDSAKFSDLSLRNSSSKLVSGTIRDQGQSVHRWIRMMYDT